MRKVLIAVAGAASLAAGLSGPAFAAATQRVAIKQVDFRDPAAVDAFYARLRRAARDVCTTGYIVSTRSVDSNRNCVEATVADAVRTLDRPLLTAKQAQRQEVLTARGY